MSYRWPWLLTVLALGASSVALYQVIQLRADISALQKRPEVSAPAANPDGSPFDATRHSTTARSQLTAGASSTAKWEAPTAQPPPPMRTSSPPRTQQSPKQIVLRGAETVEVIGEPIDVETDAFYQPDPSPLVNIGKRMDADQP
jgi:hypothetical protein